MNILVIAAHPDDEVLGCGGTIARKVSEGHEVRLLIMGEGITSRKTENETQKIEELRDCTRKVAKILGIKDIHFNTLPDNRFDTIPFLRVTKFIEDYLNEHEKPDIIFTHHPGDLNIDHRLTARAVLTATRPVEGSCGKTVISFEVLSSTEWAFNAIKPSFEPNMFVDISDFTIRKIQALCEYTSEIRNPPHPRSIEGINALATYRGFTAGFYRAEAFQVLRWIE